MAKKKPRKAKETGEKLEKSKIMRHKNWKIEQKVTRNQIKMRKFAKNANKK